VPQSTVLQNVQRVDHLAGNFKHCLGRKAAVAHHPLAGCFAEAIRPGKPYAIVVGVCFADRQ
jgi:hypothetical protein